ncbi:MAG: head GIN domain-containing protein [Flavobacteriaceae bacterium]
MKHTLIFLFAFISAQLYAQEIITKEVGDFNELKVYDLIVVTLIQSQENKVVLKGENTQDVNVVNKNGTLKIKMEVDKIFQGEETYVEVYFKNIDAIDANEGAFIVGNEMISQNTIELRAQEGGRIRVGLKANHTKIKAVTGGIVEASGISKTQEITLNTGGIFEGRDLKTQDTKIGITAAGEADINASEKVDVSVTAGGDVYIYGNPKTVNEKRFAGGRIKRMN